MIPRFAALVACLPAIALTSPAPAAPAKVAAPSFAWRYQLADGAPYLWFGVVHRSETEYFDEVSFSCMPRSGKVTVNAYVEHKLPADRVVPFRIAVDGKPSEWRLTAIEGDEGLPASIYGDVPAASLPIAIWAQGKQMVMSAGRATKTLPLAGAATPMQSFAKACGIGQQHADAEVSQPVPATPDQARPKSKAGVVVAEVLKRGLGGLFK